VNLSILLQWSSGKRPNAPVYPDMPVWVYIFTGAIVLAVIFLWIKGRRKKKKVDIDDIAL
jgi:hypothetical protein